MSCKTSIQSKATWRFFLFAVALFLLPSVTRSQAQVPSSRVTLSSTTVTVENFFSAVESQTNCLVVYSEANIQPSTNVTFSRKEAPLSSFVQEFASKFGLDYSYSNGYITFSKGKATPSSGRLVGTVLESSGNPVMGAGVVIVQNPTVGTVTDLDGNFSLNVIKGQSLRISSVGYDTKEVTVNSFSPMTILLDVSSEYLDDVIVIGYGSAKKADLTGATSSVEGERIAAKSTPQLSTQLQGMMAGVQVTRSTGDPSGGATIRVRGITTNSTNDPLVIIDGVPGSLDDVSSSDVKDIQVLKDAASASIYGSRAAAGVILVTTKRAKTNEFRMNYNFEYGIDKPTAVPQFARAALWMTGMNEVSYNDAGTTMYSQDLIDNFEQYHMKDPDTYPDTDWMGEGLKKSTTHQRHSFSLVGGSEKLRTSTSINYYDGNGLSMGKRFQRYTVRSNNDYYINNWIHATADINLVEGDYSYALYQEGSVLQSLMYRAPIYPIYYSTGEYAYGKSGDNSIAAMDLGGKAVSDFYKISGKLQVDFTLFKGFTLTAAAAPTYYFRYGKTHRKKFQLNDGGVYKDASQFSSTSVSETRNNSSNLTTQLYANYKINLGGHTISAMAGYEGFTTQWENLGASRTNYSLDNYPYLNLGPEDFQYNSGTAGHNAYNSVFGRLMYSFSNRYLLQANVRADASSRFAKGYRWGVFPSFSAGWVISEEPWFNNKGAFNFLKLRASVGQLGNERIGSEFPYMATLSVGTSYIPTGGSAPDMAQNVKQVDYAFNDITWETTTTYGVGVDLAMLKSRLHFTGDVYYKKTTDMLLQIGFPSYFGFNAPQNNAADMNTRGWEFSISWNDRVGDFNYGASFNLSDYRSRMGYMADRQSISGNKITEEGSYFQEWYMYESKGIILNEAAMTGADGKKIPVLTASDKPGCLQFVDQDGDGIISASGDRVYRGNSLPEYQFGGAFWASWKGFDFNLSFQGIGHQLSYWTWPVTPFNLQAYASPKNVMDSHWSPFATDAENAKAKYPLLSTNTTNVYAGSDFWLFNGGYLRVKDITLGYTIPSAFTRRIKIDNLRLYASVNDLPAFSKYPKGYDPEWNRSGDLLLTSFLFGVNVTF